MTSITIPDVDDTLQSRLRSRAVRHGRSMEDEARDILRAALSNQPNQARNLAAAIRARFAPLGGVELPQEPRGPMRTAPDFGS